MLGAKIAAIALTASILIPVTAFAAGGGSYGYHPDPDAPLGSMANPIPRNSPTPAALAYRLTPDDPNLVTNGPVPDTAANRAKFGSPLSQGGRATEPTGD